jgi:hypothetical protein
VFYGALAIYVVLSVFFIADVLRQTALSGAGKAAWIAALVLVPVVAWVGYGFWRMRHDRGL